MNRKSITCIGSSNDWRQYWLRHFTHASPNFYRGGKSAKFSCWGALVSIRNSISEWGLYLNFASAYDEPTLCVFSPFNFENCCLIWGATSITQPRIVSFRWNLVCGYFIDLQKFQNCWALRLHGAIWASSRTTGATSGVTLHGHSCHIFYRGSFIITIIVFYTFGCVA